MRKQTWTKRDPIKNYFPKPNEHNYNNQSRCANEDYGFLHSCENRNTYQCLLRYPEIE